MLQDCQGAASPQAQVLGTCTYLFLLVHIFVFMEARRKNAWENLREHTAT